MTQLIFFPTVRTIFFGSAARRWPDSSLAIMRIMLLDLVVGDLRLGVSAADAGVVGEKQELAAAQDRAGAHDNLAGVVVAAAGDRIQRDALLAQGVGGG